MHTHMCTCTTSQLGLGEGCFEESLGIEVWAFWNELEIGDQGAPDIGSGGLSGIFSLKKELEIGDSRAQRDGGMRLSWGVWFDERAGNWGRASAGSEFLGLP